MAGQDIIMRVRHNKDSKQKLVTIPKDAPIKKGDYVSIKKVKI